MSITAPFLPIPEVEITRRRTWCMDIDLLLAREIAGPLFDTGVSKINLAQVPDYCGSRHQSADHWFGLILQGRMQVTLDGSVLVAGPGELVCIPAGTVNQKMGLGPLRWIYMEIDDRPRWSSLKRMGHSVRKYESADHMYLLLSSLFLAYQKRDVHSIRCARENADMLLKLLNRELQEDESPGENRQRDQLSDLLECIQRHPEEEWTRRRMAQETNMSERNLTRVFLRIYNRTPGQMVIDIRMGEAADRMRKSDIAIKDLAIALGYKSTFSLSRQFRKHMGVSPSEYRKLTDRECYDLRAGLERRR